MMKRKANPPVVNRKDCIIGCDRCVAVCPSFVLEIVEGKSDVVRGQWCETRSNRNSDVERRKCVDGITANKEHCRKLVENSIGIVTALNPIIGYQNSTAIAKEALETNRSVYDLVLEKGLLTKEKLDEILSPENMMRPRFVR